MGALHEGHLSLVRRARACNITVVVSIFVNPTQFGDNEDLSTYPRDMEGDLAKLENEGVDLVFVPRLEDIYPTGFGTYVDVGPISERLEGASRPGHFRGVATVVCKLLSIVRPDHAYFGQKDAQQCMVVRRLNTDLNMDTEIVVLPIIREADGLALSSRNRYLSPKDRTSALVLHRALCLASRLHRSGITDANDLRAQMNALIKTEPRASVDYVSIADADTLVELEYIDRSVLVSLAVRIGDIRLIDNVQLGTTIER